VTETKHAILKMKSNKEAGWDGIPGELFKVGMEENAMIMATLFEKIWEEERVPAEWLRGNMLVSNHYLPHFQ
jgi:hypothetical protein